jgi:hypothetical protein
MAGKSSRDSMAGRALGILKGVHGHSLPYALAFKNASCCRDDDVEDAAIEEMMMTSAECRLCGGEVPFSDAAAHVEAEHDACLQCPYCEGVMV